MKIHNSNLQPDIRKRQTRSFWALFLVGLILVPAGLAEILAPAFIDGIFGHRWGSVAAVANIIVWIYLGIKVKLAPSTRVIIWLLPFILVVLIAVIEFGRLFHWSGNVWNL
jgi:hypothetical protein